MTPLVHHGKTRLYIDYMCSYHRQYTILYRLQTNYNIECFIIPRILCKDRNWLRADHMHMFRICYCYQMGGGGGCLLTTAGRLLTEMTQTSQ